MPEQLGRRKMALPPVRAKINELIAKHVHMRGFVLPPLSIKHGLWSVGRM